MQDSLIAIKKKLNTSISSDYDSRFDQLTRIDYKHACDRISRRTQYVINSESSYISLFLKLKLIYCCRKPSTYLYTLDEMVSNDTMSSYANILLVKSRDFFLISLRTLI